MPWGMWNKEKLGCGFREGDNLRVKTEAIGSYTPCIRFIASVSRTGEFQGILEFEIWGNLSGRSP